MRTFHEGVLQNGINRTLDDTAESIIVAAAVSGYGSDDFPKIRECLKRWESEGILRIIADPEGLPNSAPCLEMLKYIHRRSAIPGFLNWDED